MDAKELRIGNYIKEQIQGNVVQVASIIQVENGIFDIEVKDNDGMFCDIQEYIEPIPLTEQWLLDFGFEKSQDEENVYNILCFSMDTDVFMMNLFHEGEGFSYRIGLSSAKHVHQLQNLYYSLTGEELTKK